MKRVVYCLQYTALGCIISTESADIYSPVCEIYFLRAQRWKIVRTRLLQGVCMYVCVCVCVYM